MVTGTKVVTAVDARQEALSGEIWLSRGSRLIVAAVPQLRLATRKEVLEHQLMNPRELPWTTIDGKQTFLPGQCEDIRADMPEDEDFEMAARDVAGEYGEREPPRRERSRSPRGAQARAGESPLESTAVIDAPLVMSISTTSIMPNGAAKWSGLEIVEIL